MAARILHERRVLSRSNQSPKSELGFIHPKRSVAQFGLQEGMQVADFGAGSGAYAKLLSEAVGTSGRVYAVDVQKDLLKRIKNGSSEHSNIDVIWGDVEEVGGVKLSDHTLDSVLISNLLFQVEDKRSAVLEAKRVLKPKGFIIIIDWSDSFGGMGPREEDVVTREAAVSLFEKEGFALHREIDAGAHHYGLIFRATGAVQY